MSPKTVQAAVRIPVELRDAAQAEAKRLGISYGEFVRQCIYVRLTWNAAIAVARSGVDLTKMTDVQELAAIIDEINCRHAPDAERDTDPDHVE